MGGEAALAASSHDPHLGASARAHPRTPARCRLYAQAVAAAQRSDCHRTGASISGVMCGVSRPARAFWQPSNVQGSVASFSRPVHGRARALMPPGSPARLQANADRLGRARNHVRSRISYATPDQDVFKWIRAWKTASEQTRTIKPSAFAVFEVEHGFVLGRCRHRKLGGRPPVANGGGGLTVAAFVDLIEPRLLERRRVVGRGHARRPWRPQ